MLARERKGKGKVPVSGTSYVPEVSVTSWVDILEA